MNRCGRFGTNVLFLSDRQSDDASYVCDAISEEADLILAAAVGGGRRDTLPQSLPVTILSYLDETYVDKLRAS